jgi:hypothetical protein
MKRFTTASLTIAALCALLPATLTRCGGNAAELGTETGNPPVINKGSLHLEDAPGGVRLVGTAGAVTPGADVDLTNQRTGATEQTRAAADGSIEVVVAGQSTDVYEVTVNSGGRETSVTLTAAELPDDLTTLSCNGLENALGDVVAASFAAADTACSEDADCLLSQWGAGCYSDCGDTVLSSTGQTAALADAEQRTAPVCAELERRPCERRGSSPCTSRAFGAILCRSGQCIGADANELSCTELERVAAKRRVEVAQEPQRACQVDADCTVLSTQVSCAAYCNFPDAVARGAVEEVQSRLQSIEQELCGPATAMGCVTPALPCPAPPRNTTATCVQGQCTAQYQSF